MYKILVLILFITTLLSADSFVGMENYPQITDASPNYLDFEQTTVIEDGEVSDILYPTLGFPALITPEDHTMSVLFRCSAEPLGGTVILSREIDGQNISFLTKEVDTFSQVEGTSICKAKITIPPLLPATVFDLTIRLVGGVAHFSRHAVGFVKSGAIQFIIFADPQIEDLQAKKSTDMNYNNKTYPGYSDSILDYSIQEGILGASISQWNLSSANFIASLGDVVFGINYQDEYRQMADFILKSELPFFTTPGNHDGYARFNNQNDFQSGLDYDGLNYWRTFFGPVSSAFTLKKQTFIMLNTYSGTAERRASGTPLGIGDNAAVPVSNYGGFLQESEQNWVDIILEQKSVAGILSHQLPLGLLGKDEPYTAMEKFPDNSVIGGLTHEEWNFESDSYDSDTFDSILNETMSFNTGTRLTFSLSLYNKPISYFAGHAHIDKNICFEEGDLLVPNTEIKATKNICFFQTTTASTSGSYYWGMRPITIEDDAISANYLCNNNAQCRPNSEDNQGFQSLPSGNLWANYSWGENRSIYLGGDGKTPIIRATVVNYLPTDETVLLRFIIPANKSGYSIDNKDFSIDDIAISEDKTTAYIILSGIVSAGSTLEQFYAKEFHDNTIALSLKIETGSTKGLLPEITCTETLFRGDAITCTVENIPDTIRTSWALNNAYFSATKTLSFSSNKCEATCEIDVDIIDKYGRFGTASTTVIVQEHPSEEPEEIPEVDDNPVEIDDEEIPDEDGGSKPVKTGSCSALFV